jgi:branched-chain amino acid transport system permease protein
MAEWTNIILQGVLVGGLYALFATGLSLSFGIMRTINIAHGDLAVMAGFTAILLQGRFGLPLILVLPVVVLLAAAMGYGLQRAVLNRVLGGDILPPLLITFGVSIVAQNLLLAGFSADSRSLPVGDLGIASVTLGGDLAVGVLPLIVMAVAVAVLAALQWLFSTTRIGRAFRAASDDPEVAGLMGIDRHRVYALAMALAVAAAAVAGVFMAMRSNIGPTDGPSRLLYAFEAVIMGGMGSLWGTLLGGVLLGVAQSVALKIDPGWGILGGHIAFFAVLLVRPSGLLPRTRER